MTGLAVISLVLVGSVALLTSGVIGCALPWVTARLGVLEPKSRSRVVLGLLVSPWIAGAVVLLLSFGPCLGARIAGVPDTCAEHGGPHLFLCLERGGHPSTLAWLLGALIAARASHVFFGAARAARKTSRLARALRQLQSKNAAGYFVVPGRASFTAGWPRGEIFVGSGLIAAVAPPQLAVVIAHERAHQRRAHVLVKVAARALAAFHFPNVARRLILELDTALEQVCDLDAARETGDPVLVAESLIEVARLNAASPAGALAGFNDGPDVLDRRVSALCNPPWDAARSTRTVAIWLAVNGGLLLITGLFFDRQLHDITESLLQILGT